MNALGRVLIAAALAVLAGCGGDDKPSGERGATGSSAEQKANAAAEEGGNKKPAAAPAAGEDAKKPLKGKNAPITPYDKVPEEYRHEFTKADFLDDVSGEINRDPFRPFLINVMPVNGGQNQGPQEDECSHRMVAGNCQIGDLKLVGIYGRGTVQMGYFVDGKGQDYKVKVGDCLSKDRVKIMSTSALRVVGQMRANAAPGAGEAPPAIEKEWVLHPEDLAPPEQEGSGEGGQ